MTSVHEIWVLLVEDDAADALLIQEALGLVHGVAFSVTHVSRLSEALERVAVDAFEVVLLDLNLPDSTGLHTFEAVFAVAKDIPVLVLTALADEDAGIKAVQLGAQEFLVKAQVQNALLGRVIRFVIERHQLKHTLNLLRQREEQKREFASMELMSRPRGTALTARLYSASPLRESAVAQFDAIVSRYGGILDMALDWRVHREDNHNSKDLLELGFDLGLLHAGPRDVIDVHVRSLKSRISDACEKKAQAYMDEGRLIVLELMGNLAGFYRRLAIVPREKELSDE